LEGGVESEGRFCALYTSYFMHSSCLIIISLGRNPPLLEEREN
jgi:hypothetical protein